MTIGIYCIRHVESGKRYIGKSVDIERRWKAHNRQSNSRHISSALKKYGTTAFAFEIIEKFDVIDASALVNRELHWIDHFDTCNRAKGYNLRRDSSSRSYFHEESRSRMSISARLKAPPSPATRAKLSDATKAACADPAVMARRIAATKAAFATPESKLRRIAAQKAAVATPEARSKMSAARAAEWTKGDIRARRLASLKAARSTPESRARTSAASKVMHARRRTLKVMLVWVTAP
ncbi:GIY-YIG nuclease family protein [Mesorhizobium sp. M0145]|uniref:GIY-YIG nuclease family protein n=1 Tax=Mesorhizobium sp. M0145 TaxID=2956895 RepID=UPI00333D0609